MADAAITKVINNEVFRSGPIMVLTVLYRANAKCLTVGVLVGSFGWIDGGSKASIFESKMASSRSRPSCDVYQSGRASRSDLPPTIILCVTLKIKFGIQMTEVVLAFEMLACLAVNELVEACSMCKLAGFVPAAGTTHQIRDILLYLLYVRRNVVELQLQCISRASRQIQVGKSLRQNRREDTTADDD